MSFLKELDRDMISWPNVICIVFGQFHNLLILIELLKEGLILSLALFKLAKH